MRKGNDVVRSYKLFKIVADGSEELLGDFENFYEAVESTESYMDAKLFRLYDDKKYMTGIRLASDQVVWRLPRKGREKRGRDRWFQHLLSKIYREIRSRL